MKTQIVKITNIEDGTKLFDYPSVVDEVSQTVEYIHADQITLDEIVDVMVERDIDTIDDDDNVLNGVSTSHIILATLLFHLVGEQRAHDLMWKISRHQGINQLSVDMQWRKFSIKELAEKFAENEDFTIFLG